VLTLLHTSAKLIEGLRFNGPPTSAIRDMDELLKLEADRDNPHS
jgi:hypothetical protein